MNVTLINTPDSNVYEGFKRPNIKNLPLGLAYIASQLEKDGHNVVVIDPIADNLGYDIFLNKIIESKPEILGTSATTPIITNALKIIKDIKLIDNSIYTVIGGPHISATPKWTLINHKEYLDFVVYGEGEQSISELVNRLSTDKDFTEVKGIGYLKNNEVIINSKRDLIYNLDNIPFPARHLFNIDKYVNEIRFDKTKSPHISLTSSRGCIGRCTFCGSDTTWGHGVRFRSPENIIQEIKYCHYKFNSNNFIFVDDTFTTNRSHIIEICDRITQLPFDIRIFCSSRVDTIDVQKLSWLKKAGCDCITYGIESGDNNILRLMRKNTTVDMIKYAIKITKDADIGTHGSFIIGNLGDSEETINKTIELSISLDLDQVQFSILVPLPGTKCYEQALEENRFKGDPKDYKSFFWYYSVVANMTDDVTDEKLIDLQKTAYSRWKLSKQSELGDI